MLSVSTSSDVMCPAAVMMFWGREIYGNAIQRTAVTATPSGIDKCHFTRLLLFLVLTDHEKFLLIIFTCII